MEVSELFDICQQLATDSPSATAARRLHEVLLLCCGSQEGTFGNLFSQIDWLCKHHDIADNLRYAVQTARRHSNRYDAANDDAWLYDVSAVALFAAALFKADVPSDLLRLLPTPKLQTLNLKLQTLNLKLQTSAHLRCIVRSADDHFIYADTADGPVTIDYLSSQNSYLRRLLREGMQLNLLDCQLKASDQPLIAKVIVVEPDFLIDISSLAACFTNYGHHPLLYTVNRLKPKANTQAMLLGNFAGTALDDIINDPQHASLDSSLQRSYQEQPMRYEACESFDRESFRNDAAIQVENIREAVNQLFHTEGFETKQALLEPSFVCERLGLQGRVDLMTTDMALLVEQKAGRNMKIEGQSRDPHGLQREDHYVQLLLYYGILRYNFGCSDRQVDTRLLYSRYPAQQGLLIVNFFQSLFRDAIRLRNQIVATELHIARHGFQSIVPHLTAATIYKDVKTDGYFHRFVQPGIDRLQQQLASLNSLERAYFHRMATFVYREQACQKLGSPQAHLHSGGSASDLWLMPLEEKLETGNIYLGLTISGRQRSTPQGGYDIITLKPPPTPLQERGRKNSPPSLGGGWGEANFRRGDMVCLYRYEGEPDVRRSILYKGCLMEIGASQLVVALNDGQQNPDIFLPNDGSTWAVEHSASDTSCNNHLRSLYQFATSAPRRRALLLGQRLPEADTSLKLSKSYSPHLDDILLHILQARDYFLLQGPPGTGKTSMALRYIVEEELARTSSNILLTAYTNRAVDEICAMLTDAGHNFLRLGNAASCDPRFHHRLIQTSNLKPQTSNFKPQTSNIFVSTTSMLQTQPWLLQLEHFSLAVVDEASQILEPAIIGLLSSPSIRRFVLVGDHKQLPAVVQQSGQDAAVSDPQLQAIGLNDCRQSLFERLLRWEHQQGRTQFTGILHRQGRMHPDVARFATTHFYAREQLTAVPCPHQEEPSAPLYDVPPSDALDALLAERRVMFFPVNTSTLHTSDKSNSAEARLVADLLRRIHRFCGERFDARKTVGVIVPYRNQIATIRNEMERLCLPADLKDITIDTVERYQGSQRDVIIYSFTVSLRYQLDFLASNTFTDSDGHLIDRKLNVALTRARRQLLLVGNPEVLSTNPLFGELVQQYSV